MLFQTVVIFLIILNFFKISIQSVKSSLSNQFFVGILLHQNHFDKAIQVLQAAHADSIGAPKIPNVCWKDIGGLSNVKREIMDTIQLPFEYPELFAAGLQRSGKKTKLFFLALYTGFSSGWQNFAIFLRMCT